MAEVTTNKGDTPKPEVTSPVENEQSDGKHKDAEHQQLESKDNTKELVSSVNTDPIDSQCETSPKEPTTLLPTTPKTDDINKIDTKIEDNKNDEKKAEPAPLLDATTTDSAATADKSNQQTTSEAANNKSSERKENTSKMKKKQSIGERFKNFIKKMRQKEKNGNKSCEKNQNEGKHTDKPTTTTTTTADSNNPKENQLAETKETPTANTVLTETSTSDPKPITTDKSDEHHQPANKVLFS